MKKWHRIGYVRVGALDQNTERQLDGIKLDKVFTEKAWRLFISTCDKPDQGGPRARLFVRGTRTARREGAR